MTGNRRRFATAGLLALLLAFAPAMAKDLRKDVPRSEAPAAPRAQGDAALQQAMAALAPQRPGHRDLFVLAIAGDGSENVFRNEVLHLRELASRRLDAAGHVLVLANHPGSPVSPALPEASATQIRAALAGLGERMDVDEDILLLYVTTHGTPDHALYLNRPGRFETLYRPRTLAAALDASGIRHRVLVLSACYAGGFADALRGDDTLLLMAAREDRPSFGCGNDSAATYFGRAWLVDGLNATVDFAAAFDRARTAIRAREREDELPGSYPQFAAGARIGATLAAWRDGFVPGPAVPYPHADPDDGRRRRERGRDDDAPPDQLKTISAMPRRDGN